MSTLTSATFRNSVLTYMFKKPSGSGFGYSTMYLGLSSTAPTLDANQELTNIVEPSGEGYQRAAITRSSSSYVISAMGTASNGIITNVEEIHFNQATEATEGGVGWGTLGYWVLYESQTGGTPLVAGTLEDSITVTAGKVVVLKAQDVDEGRTYGDLKVEFPSTAS